MRPVVNMCLPFALEDYAWVNSCCRSGTAVFTGSVAVTRPFVSDVTLGRTMANGTREYSKHHEGKKSVGELATRRPTASEYCES